MTAKARLKVQAAARCKRYYWKHHDQMLLRDRKRKHVKKPRI